MGGMGGLEGGGEGDGTVYSLLYYYQIILCINL